MKFDINCYSLFDVTHGTSKSNCCVPYFVEDSSCFTNPIVDVSEKVMNIFTEDYYRERG